jgi:GntR family transcriptional regulator
MAIRVDSSSAVPIYEQITDQIVFMVAAGDLVAGDPMLSVRELSVKLGINPNTVVRAYQELERMGVIEPIRGRGMFITSDAAKTCRDRRKELIRDTVKATVREAVSAGLTPDDLHALIDAEWPHPIRNGSHKSK